MVYYIIYYSALISYLDVYQAFYDYRVIIIFYYLLKSAL